MKIIIIITLSFILTFYEDFFSRKIKNDFEFSVLPNLL